ncbi:hypothetical protein SUDANB19_01272 [Streptomyces sp. enrichment culture]
MYPLHQEAIRVTRVPATTAWHIPHAAGCDPARYRDRSPTTASEGQVAGSHEETRQPRQSPPRRTLRAARSRRFTAVRPKPRTEPADGTGTRPTAPSAPLRRSGRTRPGQPAAAAARPARPARRPPAARSARRSERGGQHHRPTGRQRREPTRFPTPAPPAAGPAAGGAARLRTGVRDGPAQVPARALVRPGTERRARTAAVQRHRHHRTVSGGAGDLTGTPAPAGSAYGSREARAGAGAPGPGVTSPPWSWRGNTGTASGRAARPCWTRGSGRRTSAAALRRSDPAPRAAPRRSTTAPRRTR